MAKLMDECDIPRLPTLTASNQWSQGRILERSERKRAIDTFRVLADSPEYPDTGISGYRIGAWIVRKSTVIRSCTRDRQTGSYMPNKPVFPRLHAQ